MLEARVARLATVAEAARALLAALPKCEVCDERAVAAGVSTGTPLCDDCTPGSVAKPLPHAALAEALERALDAAVAAALAGEP